MLSQSFSHSSDQVCTSIVSVPIINHQSDRNLRASKLKNYVLITPIGPKKIGDPILQLYENVNNHLLLIQQVITEVALNLESSTTFWSTNSTVSTYHGFNGNENDSNGYESNDDSQSDYFQSAVISNIDNKFILQIFDSLTERCRFELNDITMMVTGMEFIDNKTLLISYPQFGTITKSRLLILNLQTGDSTIEECPGLTNSPKIVSFYNPSLIANINDGPNSSNGSSGSSGPSGPNGPNINDSPSNDIPNENDSFSDNIKQNDDTDITRGIRHYVIVGFSNFNYDSKQFLNPAALLVSSQKFAPPLLSANQLRPMKNRLLAP